MSNPIKPAYLSNHNPDTEEGFEQYQSKISHLQKANQVSGTSPDGDPAHDDRWDGQGNYYVWDQDAANGEGAWGVAGHLYSGVPINQITEDNVNDNLTWYNDNQYEEASGGAHMGNYL